MTPEIATEWIDIWTKEPYREQELLFLTGDGGIHLGMVIGSEKIRKCAFRCFLDKTDYDCDSTTDFENRVTHWFPIPAVP
jgi:hypothetical protein